MNRFKLLVGASIILIILKTALVVYTNSIGDGLLRSNQEFSDKKTKIENLKLVRDSIFKMQRPQLMDTIKKVKTLKDFLKANDEKVQRGADELLALNIKQTQDLQRLKICNALNTIINVMLVCLVAWLLIGRLRG
jgi:hypothetical protein